MPPLPPTPGEFLLALISLASFFALWGTGLAVAHQEDNSSAKVGLWVSIALFVKCLVAWYFLNPWFRRQRSLRLYRRLHRLMRPMLDSQSLVQLELLGDWMLVHVTDSNLFYVLDFTQRAERVMKDPERSSCNADTMEFLSQLQRRRTEYVLDEFLLVKSYIVKNVVV